MLGPYDQSWLQLTGTQSPFELVNPATVEFQALDIAPLTDFVVTAALPSGVSQKPTQPLFSGPNDEHGDTQGTATAITIGDTLTGVINDDFDLDYFSFSATAGQTIIFRADEFSDFARLIIETPSGTGGGDFSDGTGTIAFTAQETGTYYAVIDGALVNQQYNFTSEIGAPDIPGDSTTSETITIGGSATSQHDGFQDTDWFAFDATAGQAVLFSVDSDFYYRLIRIYDANSNLVAETVGFSEVLDYTFETAGRYYVEVDLGNADIGTAYTLNAAVSPDDWGETAASAGTLSLSTDGAGNLHIPRDVDWFEFDAVAGQMLSFRVDLNIGDLEGSGNVSFFNAAGEALNSSGGAGGFDPSLLITYDGSTPIYHFDALETGPIYVAVSGTFTSDDIFPVSYTVDATVRTGDVAGNINSTAMMTVGQTYQGSSFANGDIDYVGIDMVAGEAYLISVQASPGSTYLLNLVTDTGEGTRASEGFQQDFDAGLMQALFIPEFTGTYFLSVATDQYTGGNKGTDYTVMAEIIPDDHGDSHQDATAMGRSLYLTGVHEVTGDQDWFSVDVEVGESVIFHRQDFLSLDSFTDGSGNVVGNSAYGVIGGVSAGTYYVGTSSFNFSSSLVNSRAFNLKGERVMDEVSGDTQTQGTLSAGQTVAGLLTAQSDEDWYEIQVQADDVITFQAVDQSGFSLTYTLYDSAGTVVGDIPSGTYEATFFVGGTYYVGVSMSSDALGEYTLTWFGSGTNEIIGSGTGGDFIQAGAGSSELFGLAGDDRLDGGAGDDIIHTGIGFDTVIFGLGDGQDRVTDFNPFLDRLALDIDPLTSRAELASMMTDTVDGLRVTLSDGSAIVLEGISVSDMTRDSFLFTAETDNGPGPFWGSGGYDYGPKGGASQGASGKEPLSDPVSEANDAVEVPVEAPLDRTDLEGWMEVWEFLPEDFLLL